LAIAAALVIDPTFYALGRPQGTEQGKLGWRQLRELNAALVQCAKAARS
jgi:hypothetical protein